MVPFGKQRNCASLACARSGGVALAAGRTVAGAAESGALKARRA